MQDSASFWTDIKNLEEQLAKSPDSFCFALLSEVYLKVGLVDDALHISKQGVAKHPGYLSGQRALALACYAKGLNDEAMAALKLVTKALPEDVPSQKLLGRLYAEAGNHDAARQAYRTALEFAPDDAECRIELGALERPAGATAFTIEPYEDDEEIIEDLEILEEGDVQEEYQADSESQFQNVLPTFDASAVQHHDPLSTGTLAELYVTQGFVNKALEIYRAILADNPSDQVIAGRVTELEALDAGPAETDAEIEETFEVEEVDEPTFSASTKSLNQETGLDQLADLNAKSALESRQVFRDLSVHESGTSVIPRHGVAENALSKLDGWLENIRRIKSCR